MGRKYMESLRSPILLQGSTYLELARLPNLITIAADVLAGYWIANGVQIDSRLLYLLLATSAVYAGACALSDYCSRGTDSPESPGRPIPSGRVERWKALIFSFSLFTVGFGVSALAAASAPQIVIFLILMAILYNVGARERVFLGPFILAGYRSLNLILGMGLPFWLGDHGLPSRYLPVFSFLYVFLLSWLSRFEVEGKSREITAMAFLGWAHFVMILLSLSFWGAMNLENLPFLALFVAFTGPTLLNAGRLQSVFAAGGAQKMMVLGIPLLDAVYCSGIQGFAAGVPVALCTVIAHVLATSKKVSCDLTQGSCWGKESF
jgi:4-hydroxybenzoate polyprenyltransferase